MAGKLDLYSGHRANYNYMGRAREEKRWVKPMEVSYSQIRVWRSCQQRYYYQYVENLEPRVKKVQLERGSIIHELLELIARGEDWEGRLGEYQREFKKLFIEERELYGDLPADVERIVRGYLKYWRHQPLKFIVVEQEFGPIPLTKHTSLTMKIDGIAKDREKRKWLVERKSHEKMPDEAQRMSDLQTLLYAWGLKQLGYEVHGVLWDYIRTKPPTKPEVLKNGTISRRKNIDTDYDTYLETLRENGQDPDDYRDMLDMLRGAAGNFYQRVYEPLSWKMVKRIVQEARATSLEMYYLRDSPVRNLSWMCKFCPYFSLCYAEVRGLDSDFIRQHEFKVKEGESGEKKARKRGKR